MLLWIQIPIFFGEKLKQIDHVSTITQNSYIKLLNDKDSIIIRGDMIEIDDDNCKINKNVTISGKDLKGECSIMEFQSNYTKINMYKAPVLWFSNIQITGDIIRLHTLNNQLDSIYIPINPFIIFSKRFFAILQSNKRKNFRR